MNTQETRSHETIVEIAASPETVWRGITEAQEIMRWFAPEARVEPGEGGSMLVSWGPGYEGAARIAIWEPGKHLRTIEQRSHGGDRLDRGGVMETGGEQVEIAVDYYLEAKGGSTVLRLVHSGFGTGSDWDNEFESTRYGWMIFVRNLRHALTRHPGVPCRQAMVSIPSPLPSAETWTQVMGPRGLLASGSAAGLVEGDHFSWRAANGDRISGIVSMSLPPLYIGGSLEQANDALFGITVVPPGVILTFMFYGVPDEAAEAVQSRWSELIRSAVGAPAVPSDNSAACADAAT